MTDGMGAAGQGAVAALEELETRELQSTDYAERLQLLVAQANLRGQLAIVEAVDRLTALLDHQAQFVTEGIYNIGSALDDE